MSLRQAIIAKQLREKLAELKRQTKRKSSCGHAGRHTPQKRRRWPPRWMK